MSKSIGRIKALMSSLPDKDIPLGYKFLEARDFEQLKELIDSALFKVKRNQRIENPKEEYMKISLEDLSMLKSEVDTYIVQLNIISDNSYCEFNCELEEEDFY